MRACNSVFTIGYLLAFGLVKPSGGRDKSAPPSATKAGTRLKGLKKLNFYLEGRSEKRVGQDPTTAVRGRKLLGLNKLTVCENINNKKAEIAPTR